VGVDEITMDDPGAGDVRELLGRYLEFAHSHNPPEDVQVLRASCGVRGDRGLQVLAGLAAPPAARGLLIPGSPRLAQHGIGLARRNGHEHGGLSAGSLQLRVSRQALVVRRSRVEARTRGGGDVFGHTAGVGLRQLADGTGADEPGLLAYLVPELLAAVLDCDAEGSDLR
jgi:hypothetical protein